jgi:hypothetical protein
MFEYTYQEQRAAELRERAARARLARAVVRGRREAAARETAEPRAEAPAGRAGREGWADRPDQADRAARAGWGARAARAARRVSRALAA